MCDSFNHILNVSDWFYPSLFLLKMYKRVSNSVNNHLIPHKKYLLLIILIIPIYTILLFVSNLQSLSIGLAQFKWENLIMALFFAFLAQIVRSFRWNFWLKQISKKISLKDNILFYFCGLILVITPARLGESIRSFFMKQDYGVSFSKTIPVVFVERFYELVIIGVMASVSLLFVDFNKLIIMIPAIFTIGIIIIANKRTILQSILKRLSKRKLFSKIIPNMEESTETFHLLIGLRQLTPAISLSMVAGILDMIGIYYLIIGLKLNISFPETILIMCSSIVAGYFSFIPGGFGAVEGSIIALLTIKGVPYSSSLIFLLLYRIISTLFLTIIGVVTFQHVVRREKKIVRD